jgi:hypothetical protein
MICGAALKQSPCERQHQNLGRPALTKCPGAVIGRRSGREHIVDQKRTAAHSGGSCRKRAGHVDPPGPRVQLGLRQFVAQAPEPAGDARYPQPGGQRASQQFCLVEPAGDQPPGVQWNGDDRLHAGQEVWRGKVGEQQPERPSGRPPGPVLQSMDRFAEGTVVDEDRSCRIKRRWASPAAITEAGWSAYSPRRPNVRRRIVVPGPEARPDRVAAAPAHGRLDPAEPRETTGTEMDPGRVAPCAPGRI